MKASLQKQASNPQSPLQGVKLDPGAASVETRNGRRYVAYGYDADACRRLSEDGECLRRGTQYVEARVSVSLESQARTLEEQRRMDEGEMEQRYVDTLWVFTASAPKGAGDAALGALRERRTKVEAGRALARGDDVDAAQVAAVVSERLSTVVDDIDFGVRSPMFEFTIITSDAEALSFAKLQKAAAYVFDG